VGAALAAVRDRQLLGGPPACLESARDRRRDLGRGHGALELVGRDHYRRAQPPAGLPHSGSRASRNARSAASPCTAKTMRSRPPWCVRATPTMIRAASVSGKPPTPV